MDIVNLVMLLELNHPHRGQYDALICKIQTYHRSKKEQQAIPFRSFHQLVCILVTATNQPQKIP